jgi:DNA-binding MarR family transcriptional regulator/GNAT superfamily N-acetyltransferase
VRQFNRFYTRRIGVLEERLLASQFSLPEARALYEIATREAPTAATIARDLSLDPGYLSRLLGGLERRGLVSRVRSETDGRQSLLRLTETGRNAFAELDARSSGEMARLLSVLTPAQCRRLVGALHIVESLLGEPEKQVPFLLRAHRPGDLGWVIHRHAVLYAEEYGWDGQFEAFVAEIAAAFVKSFDATRECCWIAERRGEIVGSVCLVHVSPNIAKLRLLLVEPSARGFGIGRRLVEECAQFARRVGYRKITLWTNDVLVAARRLYESQGFRLVAEEPYHRFGKDLVGQTWELPLSFSSPSGGTSDGEGVANSSPVHL